MIGLYKPGFKMMENVIQFQTRLLNWYQQEARELPWRSDPSPYKVWISEAMLQQTRVDTVIPYFNRFIREIPSIQDLAEVEEEKLLKLWQGLGYYRRAAHLKQAAQRIVQQFNGELPSNSNELRSLPGIGAYTAGAIASIAFGIPVPAVDGNVLRVMARLTADRGDIRSPEVKKRIEELVKKILPSSHAGNFNQALMDLGAGICLPNGIPKCGECPVKEFCNAHKKGLASTIPVKGDKKIRKVEEKTILVVSWHDRLAIRKRDEKGLLANLWELPNYEGLLTEEQCKNILEKLGFTVIHITTLKKAKHAFTHMEWVMTGYSIYVEGTKDLSQWTWVTKEEVNHTYPIPNAFKYFLY